MKNYTEKRLESKKRLETIVGGYCYAQDGGNGGYEFSDIVKHIDESIHQAVAEERERVRGVINKLPTVNVKTFEEAEGIEIRGIDHTEQLISKEVLLSSLDKPLTDGEK